MERVERGEIRWCKFNAPNKTRPVLILTRDSAIRHLNEITIAEVTTRVRMIPSQVLLTDDDGMPDTCAVNLDHIRAIDPAQLGKVITVLSRNKMRLVRAALLFALGFDEELT
jgi:mRNA interferase MazF